MATTKITTAQRKTRRAAAVDSSKIRLVRVSDRLYRTMDGVVIFKTLKSDPWVMVYRTIMSGEQRREFSTLADARAFLAKDRA